jgi:uncharacterized membrane protein YqgA involved in biofilm formation
MLGTIVNTGTILAGSILGSVLKKVSGKYQDCMFNAMGFAATALGINAVVQNMATAPIRYYSSSALPPAACWHRLDLDGRFQQLVGRFSHSNLGQGLSTAICCSASVLSRSSAHPKRSARDNTYLFTNATLDFVTSMVLASPTASVLPPLPVCSFSGRAASIWAPAPFQGSSRLNCSPKSRLWAEF